MMGWKYTGLNLKGITNFATKDLPELVIPGWKTGNQISGIFTGSSTIENAKTTIEGNPNVVLDKTTQTVKGLGSVAFDQLKKYWYVPIIVGGVLIGYKALGNAPTNKLINALAAASMAEE